MGFYLVRTAPATMPGDDLLFQRLSVSTIGADWFHGRVRDGIGWVTDAMVTKQWSWRCTGLVLIDGVYDVYIWRLRRCLRSTVSWLCCKTGVDGVQFSSMNRVIRTG